MAKEAINKPEDFDENGGDAPVIELESREIKNVETTEAVADEAISGDSAAESAGSGSSSVSPEARTDEATASPKASSEELLAQLVSTLEEMREGRDAVSMRRDLVSLHDKLVPEIQASRDAAREAETANKSMLNSANDLKAMLAKAESSIGGLEGYLLVNLEERLQTLAQSVQTTRRSGSIPRWLKFAVSGNLLLTAFVLCALLWPQQFQGLIEAIATFSIGDWLASVEPRA